MKTIPHQYIERRSGRVKTETLYGDRLVNLIWSRRRENPKLLFDALCSKYVSRMLAFVSFDASLGAKLTGAQAFMQKLGIDMAECLDPPAAMDTARKIFERKIRYWETRPMPARHNAVVSPADARILIGSMNT